MNAIVSLLAKGLAKRCKEQMDIELSLSSSLKEHIVTKYADYKMGARPLKRAIQTVIEDNLAQEILSGKIKTGDSVSAGYRNEQVVFTKKEK